MPELDLSCAVCLDRLVDGQPYWVCAHGCSRLFHATCMTKLATCPLCRIAVRSGVAAAVPPPPPPSFVPLSFPGDCVCRTIGPLVCVFIVAILVSMLMARREARPESQIAAMVTPQRIATPPAPTPSPPSRRRLHELVYAAISAFAIRRLAGTAEIRFLSAPQESVRFEYAHTKCAFMCVSTSYQIGDADVFIGCACTHVFADPATVVLFAESAMGIFLDDANGTAAARMVLPIPSDCHWFDWRDTPPTDCHAEAKATLGTAVLRLARDLDEEAGFVWPPIHTTPIYIEMNAENSRIRATYSERFPNSRRWRHISIDPREHGRTRVTSYDGD